MLNTTTPGVISAAAIQTALLPANFEYVRDQIGAILKIELDNQSVLWATNTGTLLHPIMTPDLDLTAGIYVERFTPVDRQEQNVIVVGILKMDFDNQTPITQRNSVSYYIDIYVNDLEEGDVDGSYASGAKLHRLIGLIRSILQNPYYDKLGFLPGTVERRSVQSVQFSEKEHNDTVNTRAARVTFNVDIHEESTGIAPATATSYTTVVKLAATNKGFKYQYVNP